MRLATAGSGRRAVLLVACIAMLAALAVAGCGAAPDASPPATATPATSAAPSVPGPDVTPLPPGAFTFDLPAGWVVVPVSGSHDALMARLRGQDPVFADSLAARLGGLSDTTTYVAFDASPEAVRQGDS